MPVLGRDESCPARPADFTLTAKELGGSSAVELGRMNHAASFCFKQDDQIRCSESTYIRNAKRSFSWAGH